MSVFKGFVDTKNGLLSTFIQGLAIKLGYPWGGGEKFIPNVNRVICFGYSNYPTISHSPRDFYSSRGFKEFTLEEAIKALLPPPKIDVRKPFVILTKGNHALNRFIRELAIKFKYQGYPPEWAAIQADCFSFNLGSCGYNRRKDNDPHGGSDWLGYDSHDKLNVEEGIQRLILVGDVK